MTETEIETISGQDAGQRLDRWLRRRFNGLPQSRIEKLCRQGKIRIEGGRVRPSVRLEQGKEVRLPAIVAEPPGRNEAARRKAAPSGAQPAWLQDSVLYADEHLIAINKPAGIAVQGGTGQALHVDRLAASLITGPDRRPRLVHRLDKATSGVLVIACTRNAAAVLAAGFKQRLARKLYWAIVIGCPQPAEGRIQLALVRDGGRREKMTCVMPGQAAPAAKSALTDYAVLDSVGSRAALVALSPLTGRTHQLRAHLAAVGTPVMGDRRYGGRTGDDGLLGGPLQLHARTLEFDHPVSGSRLLLTAPPPGHMAAKLSLLGLEPKRFPAAPFGVGT